MLTGSAVCASCRALADFKRVFDVNVFGAFAAIQAFFPFVQVRDPRSARVVTMHRIPSSSIRPPSLPGHETPCEDVRFILGTHLKSAGCLRSAEHQGLCIDPMSV